MEIKIETHHAFYSQKDFIRITGYILIDADESPEYPNWTLNPECYTHMSLNLIMGEIYLTRPGMAHADAKVIKCSYEVFRYIVREFQDWARTITKQSQNLQNQFREINTHLFG